MNENEIQNSNEMNESQEISSNGTDEQIADSQENIADVQDAVDMHLQESEEEIIIEEPVEGKKKPLKTGAVIAITAAATAAVCAIALFVGAKFFYNPYNSNCEYMDTLKDYAEYNDQSVDELKKSFQLPSDMPGSTYVTIANQYIPLSYVVTSNGVDLATYISSLGLPEEYTKDITESTTIGEINRIMEEYSSSNPSTTGGN